MGKSIFEANNLENKTNFEERIVQNMRGVTKGVVIDMIDKATNYNMAESRTYTDYAHSIAVIPDGIGTVYITVVTTYSTFNFRVVRESNIIETFDEIFGDIISIKINSTVPYRALIRR